MIEANWPYTRIETLDDSSDPSWECPTGVCSCAEAEQPGEGYEFSIMLSDPIGVRMPGARCRVVINGILAKMNPFADGEGWVTATVAHAPQSVWVEWAPSTTPLQEDLPYRRRYYVELREDNQAESARRRLHNLSFSVQPTLGDNIKDFQVEYGHAKLTGKVDDIWDDLRKYHDEAMAPIRAKAAPPTGLPLAGAGAVPAAGVAVPQKPPAPPVDQGKPKAGNAAGQGTIAPIVSPEIFMRSIVDVVRANDHRFSWWPIEVTFPWLPATADRSIKKGTLLGIFWVFADALKEASTGMRWPCSAAESQVVADTIKVWQTDLTGWDEETDDDEQLPCLLMTSRLMDARWWHARSANRIVRPWTDNPADLLIAGCTRIHPKIEANIAALGAPGVALVADPAKVWIMHQRLFQGKLPVGSAGAVNYGWHVDQPLVTLSPPDPGKPGPHGTGAGIPVNMNTPIRPTWINQDAGGKHDVHHIDYSQQLILVAPWCQIMEADGTMTGMRTAHVYRSKKLAPLVSDDGNPFQATRLNFDRAAVDQNRALFWEHEEGRWRSKKRSGKGLLDPIPMPTVSKL